MPAAPEVLPGLGAEAVAAALREALRLRRARESFLPDVRLGDPAWEILLVLFAASLDGNRETFGSLQQWTGLKHTTLLRHVTALVANGYIDRGPIGGRSVHIALAPAGQQAMSLYLCEVAARYGSGESAIRTALEGWRAA